ncbi:hybrid sensor histidine kinase/response regulator [Butyrivibrio sp. NC2002]|uniref:hybrid sensor histidine kinase/response regulator n=1 Tax=Butyrivibrio sp. NC2002 TaxID=1410610 RepID=UPI00055FFDFD|nr:hybrid sensor histidine kinase/response regulator [Butyrivibrio sp. NC2002]
MDRSRKDEELSRSIQVVILVCYSLYVAGLVVGSIIKGWELWSIPIWIIGIVVCWSIYIRQKLDEEFTIFFYAGFISLSNFYYGTHVEAFYNSTLIIVLALLLFSLTKSKDVLRIIAVSYLMILVYHAIMLALHREDIHSFSLSVTFMHILIVIVAHNVAGYLCEMLMASKRNTEELERSLELSKEKSEDFMANVSHELRTPINVVTGLSSVLLKDEKNDKKRADMSAIQSAGRRLFSRIEDILDYTEVDTGSLRISVDEYRISSVVNDIVTDYRVNMKPNLPELIVDMDVNIPARIMGDASKVKRIIRHLIDNAGKFTDENGCVYLKIFTRKKDYGVNLCIEITDTGIGMTPEELEKVVNGIFQSDSGRSRRADGIGLGLYIVYGFVTAMGGFVHIESEKKKGTKVIVSIPQKVIDEKPSVTLESPEKMEIVCYLNDNKYSSPAIREYYNVMIMNCIKGLGLPLHKVTDFDELKKLCEDSQITHMFISQDEFLEERDFYESVKSDISVIVAVNNNYRIPKNSKITFVKKPVFSHSLVNAVNRQMSVWEFDPETSGKKLSFKGVKTLVVDDEEMNLIVANGLLSGYGMDVTVVHSGMEAIHICEKQRFDVIFMDHMMPGLDGVETMQIIRKNAGSEDKTAILAFTANAVSGVREMFIQEGFDEFLSKPIETSELERVLKKLLPSTMWEYVDNTDENDEQMQNFEDEDEYRFSLLNAKEGQRICRGSKAFYEEMLMEFANNSQEIVDELQKLYEDKNWKDYRIKLNGLKLSARIIGADDLSREAREIERAAESSWEAYIVANHDVLIRRIGAIKSEIVSVCGGEAS